MVAQARAAAAKTLVTVAVLCPRHRGAYHVDALGVQELRMVYNSNMTSKLEFKVSVEDRFAQKSIDVYRGFVQLYTDSADRAYQQTLLARRLGDDDRAWTSSNNAAGQPSVKVCRVIQLHSQTWLCLFSSHVSTDNFYAFPA